MSAARDSGGDLRRRSCLGPAHRIPLGRTNMHQIPLITCAISESEAGVLSSTVVRVSNHHHHICLMRMTNLGRGETVLSTKHARRTGVSDRCEPQSVKAKIYHVIGITRLECPDPGCVTVTRFMVSRGECSRADTIKTCQLRTSQYVPKKEYRFNCRSCHLQHGLWSCKNSLN